MNTNMMLAKLKNKNKGQWFKCFWISDVPIKASAKKGGIVVNKLTEATVRYGIDYKNQKSVQAKMEAGYELKHDLPWGSWRPGLEGVLIDHTNKAGEQNTYIRLYGSPNKSKVQYFLNGKPIEIEQLKSLGYVQESYWNKSGEKPDCFTVNIRNITGII